MGMRTRRTTIKDVAREAGVSITTVSFVLNDVEGVSISQETRDRVIETANDLRYRPNAAAATLRTNRTHSIGFITDHIAASPFAGGIILGAQQAAWHAGQLLSIIHTGNDPVVTNAAIEMLIERRVDGIICSTLAHRVYVPPETLAEVPTVFLNCVDPDGRFPSVVPDEEQGGYVATNALLEAGHQRIGYVAIHDPTVDFSGPFPPATGRLAGYRRALAEHGIEYDHELVIPGGVDVGPGYEATRVLLKRVPDLTALFCGTDRMAMGAYYALAEAGKRIPEDVSVVGFDDQQLISTNLRPALSTVALPFDALGRTAIRMLQNTWSEPEHLRLPCHYVPRASIARPSTTPFTIGSSSVAGKDGAFH